MSVERPTVYLIGGAPGAGKTTLGCALAARLGGSSITIDDLTTVAQALTSPEQPGDLFLFTGQSYLEYFTNTSPAQMQADAERQHAAIWPAVRRLIEKRVKNSAVPMVIDGWHLRPDRVAALDVAGVAPYWIYMDPKALELRERANTEFLQGSTNPDRMFENFMARSLWINELVLREAERFGQPVLMQTGAVGVDELCDQILQCRT